MRRRTLAILQLEDKVKLLKGRPLKDICAWQLIDYSTAIINILDVWNCDAQQISDCGLNDWNPSVCNSESQQ